MRPPFQLFCIILIYFSLVPGPYQVVRCEELINSGNNSTASLGQRREITRDDRLSRGSRQSRRFSLFSHRGTDVPELGDDLKVDQSAEKLAKRATVYRPTRSVLPEPRQSDAKRLAMKTAASSGISQLPGTEAELLGCLKHVGPLLVLLESGTYAWLNWDDFQSGAIGVREWRVRTAESVAYVTIELIGTYGGETIGAILGGPLGAAVGGTLGSISAGAVVLVLRLTGLGHWVAEQVFSEEASLQLPPAVAAEVSFVRSRSYRHDTLLPPELFPIH